MVTLKKIPIKQNGYVLNYFFLRGNRCVFILIVSLLRLIGLIGIIGLLKTISSFHVFLNILPQAFAESDAGSYYEQHAIGWHWYNDPILKETKETKEVKKVKKTKRMKETKKAKETKKTNAPFFVSSFPPSSFLSSPSSFSSIDPVTKVKLVRQSLEYALDRAFLNPTPQNVRNYIVLQDQVSQHADQFAAMWQGVLLEDPSLNYSLKYPINQIARQIYWDQHNDHQERVIHHFAERHGLFFFYRSTCPYCQRFAPIVKDFSQQYGITVVPITTDGSSLPEFPESRRDQGQAQKFHVLAEPALFTVNPYNHVAIPVSYGLISENELRDRVLNIVSNIGMTQKRIVKNEK